MCIRDRLQTVKEQTGKSASRDYAIFMLLAMYGLRCSEAVSYTHLRQESDAKDVAYRLGWCEPAEQGGARGTGKRTDGEKRKCGHDRQKGADVYKRQTKN